MTAFSSSDLRAQAAPARCRRCHHAELTIATDKTKRYACRKQQLMHDTCGYFVVLPFGREAVASVYNAPSEA